MEILILGAGKIGSAAAWYLVRQQGVQKVGLADISKEALVKSRVWINSDKIATHEIDVTNRDKCSQLMRAYNVGIIMLPDRRTSYSAIEAAIEAGLNIVDVLEEYHRRPDKSETEGLEIPPEMNLDEYGESLHKRASERGITILDGMGLEPGLTNVTIGEGIRKMDKADTVAVRVGGIPSKETARRHPIGYVITWAFRHVLREYMVKATVIRDGKVVEVDALSERETFRFTKFGRDEELEAAITPGMPSIAHTRKEQIRNFTAKTIRWPGHWHAIEVLKECGLLDSRPVEFADKAIAVVPRGLVAAILEPRLRWQEGDMDTCVMWNTVTGIRGGRPLRVDYYMWEEGDTRNDISAMGRTTGFTAAIAAKFLAEGKISHKGIVAPEDGITGELYTELIQELAKANITIQEEVT